MDSLRNFNKFNYIGSKNRLIDNIINIIEKKTKSSLSGKLVGDLFSGTSICGYMFRCHGANVISNDMEYYAYVIAKGFVVSSYNKNIEKIINDMNKLEGVSGLIHKNYSGERMFFTEENAKKIDSMRIYLENLRKNIPENDYYYILTCILLASDKVANIASVYGAYLKKYKQTSIKPILLKEIHTLEKETKNKVYNDDINNIVSNDIYDIIYIDPPYNSRQYSKNYHVLNYIAQYKNIPIKGITGLLKDSNISNYCRKGEVKDSFKRLFKEINSKWVFMSYNDEGLLSKEELIKLMSEYGNVSVESIEYKRFKSSNVGSSEKDKVFEYLFCVEIFEKAEITEDITEKMKNVSLKE